MQQINSLIAFSWHFCSRWKPSAPVQQHSLIQLSLRRRTTLMEERFRTIFPPHGKNHRAAPGHVHDLAYDHRGHQHIICIKGTFFLLFNFLAIQLLSPKNKHKIKCSWPMAFSLVHSNYGHIMKMSHTLSDYSFRRCGFGVVEWRDFQAS